MLSATVTTDSAALAASLTDWWALAGVDVAVQDMPRDWMAKTRLASPPAVQQRDPSPVQAPAARILAEPEPAPAAPTPTAMPETLDAFMVWLADAQPERDFAPALIMPQILPSPALLIVTDMPATDGQLFASSEAALIAAMARAIGLDMRDVAVASLLLARPAGGIVERQLARLAGERMNHFIDLVRPTSLLLLGDTTGRALEEANDARDAQPQHFVNQVGGTIPIMHLPTAAVLLKHPSRKAAAWIELRQLAAGR
ncbi:hypothetical protein BH10PSE13_BH10PSE13_16860 [soil metagenome]